MLFKIFINRRSSFKLLMLYRKLEVCMPSVRAQARAVYGEVLQHNLLPVEVLVRTYDTIGHVW